MERKRIIILAVLLMLSVRTFYRIAANEDIRLIQFLSIFAIGALSSLLIREVVLALRSKKAKVN